MPLDAPNGIDTPLPPPPRVDWNGLGHVIPINPPSGENGQEVGVSQDADMEEAMITWHDVALSVAAELMGKARDIVNRELGYSTSAVGF